MVNKQEIDISEEKKLPDIDNLEVTIKNLIYTVRGRQVMLDSDLAILYQVETKNLNKAMKRNINRFPNDFCFQLTEEEYTYMRFQFGTSKDSSISRGGRRYMTDFYLWMMRLHII